ncbi:MAG: radical SAM protein, partial [Candidatus Omnitrophota bacterium]
MKVANRERKTLAETRTLCPACTKLLKGSVVEEECAIHLTRACPEHGEYSQHISSHTEYYKGLRDYYFEVMDKNFKQGRYLLVVAGKCNLECPVCFLGGREFNDMSIPEVKDVIRRNKGAELVVFGKEPTCHGDLPEIIKLLKKTQSSVSLYTNGVRIGDRKYLNELKRARVNKIYLQFDGFKEKTYDDFRNTGMLEQKFKALENLRLEKIDTVINVTVAKGENEE